MSILQWIGGHSASFLDKFNWSPQLSPTSTSDCRVDPSSSAAISVGNATINSLVTNADATLNIVPTDTVTIRGAADLSNPTGASTNGGTISLGSASDLFLDGLFTNAGVLTTVAASDVWVNSTFTNTGAINQGGDFTVGQSHAGTAINAAGATWSISGAHDIAKGAATGSTFTNAGTLTRTGTGVTDVGVATINRGDVGVHQGKLEFLSTVVNTGAMAATGAVLELDQAVSGVGTLDIGAGGVVDILRGADSGQTIDFLGTGKLTLDSAGTFKGHIGDFAGKDLIDLHSLIGTSAGFSSGVLTVFDGSTAIAHLNFNGSYSTSSFSLTSDAHGGTLIHYA